MAGNTINLTLPSAEEMARMMAEAKNYEIPRLRWVVPAHTTTERPRLQESIRWRSASAQGIEWQDVPTVVLPGEPHD